MAQQKQPKEFCRYCLKPLLASENYFHPVCHKNVLAYATSIELDNKKFEESIKSELDYLEEHYLEQINSNSSKYKVFLYFTRNNKGFISPNGCEAIIPETTFLYHFGSGTYVSCSIETLQGSTKIDFVIFNQRFSIYENLLLLFGESHNEAGNNIFTAVNKEALQRIRLLSKKLGISYSRYNFLVHRNSDLYSPQPAAYKLIFDDHVYYYLISPLDLFVNADEDY